MSDDFDYMKKNREEYKKQLEARFQDIERYSKNNLGKFRIANNSLPMKPNEQTIPFSLFSINSSMS